MGQVLNTGLQPCSVLLISTLWAWPCNQFSTHLTVCSSSLYFISFSRRILRDSAEGLTEGKVSNIHLCLLIYQAHSFITDWSNMASPWWMNPCWLFPAVFLSMCLIVSWEMLLHFCSVWCKISHLNCPGWILLQNEVLVPFSMRWTFLSCLLHQKLLFWCCTGAGDAAWD